MENKLTFTGKILGIGPVKSGEKNGKPWAKIEFVVQETEGDYPQSAKFSMFKNGDYVKYVNGFEENYKNGDIVTVEFKLKTSNHNNNTYNNIECFRINHASIDASAQTNDEGPLFGG